MRVQGNGLPAIILVILAVSGFGLVIWANAHPSNPLRAVIPTEQIATDNPQAWEVVLREGFGSNSTALPTIALPTASFAPPTLPGSSDTNLTPIAPAHISSDIQPTLNSFVTPTLPLPTPTPLATNISVTEQFVTRPPSQWRPPALIPPISRDPLGRDHYWFARPVDSDGINYGLFSYSYGSDGPAQESPWRVHHGIDMDNPIGQTVRAAGPGTVVWAGAGFENSPSYGNVVEIRHDFGYNGQPLYTLYAHLSAFLVSQGQVVNTGDPIGLVGDTGRVSGPHVHFEVRMGTKITYGSSYNPVLWMVPYVGHGVIAGRVTGARGEELQDQAVTIQDVRTGLVVQSTTTYIYEKNASDINADPLWKENFVVGDIPVGRYQVVTSIDGIRVSKTIDVAEGMTNFVELAPEQPADATPTATPS